MARTAAAGRTPRAAARVERCPRHVCVVRYFGWLVFMRYSAGASGSGAGGSVRGRLPDPRVHRTQAPTRQRRPIGRASGKTSTVRFVPTLPRGRKLTFSAFDRQLSPSSRVCDLSDVLFVDAFGLVGTACALLAAEQAGDSPTIKWPSRPQVREHLTGMGFNEFAASIGYEVPQAGAAPIEMPTVVVPLARVDSYSAAERLSHLLWAQVRNSVDPDVLEALSESLWELIANALEHSGAEGVLMGQVYRGGEPPDHDDRVQVVVGDAGKGIRASLTESGLHTVHDDIEAVEKALEYLVSSVPDRGRGQGLSTTVESITALRGQVVVRTGRARVTADHGSRRSDRVPNIRGTIVGLSLRLYPEWA